MSEVIPWGGVTSDTRLNFIYANEWKTQKKNGWAKEKQERDSGARHFLKLRIA